MGSVELQTTAPLVAALKEAAGRQRAAFHTPGHKQGQGASETILNWFGSALFRADLPELPELDNLFAPEGAIQAAQALAADAFGAEQTWFLVNGSTCGIEAAILALCRPGDKLILPRNSHRSAIAALILTGAVPIYVDPEYDSRWGIAHSVPPDHIAVALAQHPDAAAVMVVSPTYYGACGDIAAIAALAHQHQIPLLVDEAHGPHFAFHPNLPLSALAAGADLVVQSTHKVLSSLTQAAMLHVQGRRVNRDRLQQTLQLVQSTSPSYLLLASLDAARQQMATQGTKLMAHTLALAAQARTGIKAIPGLTMLDLPAATPGCVALDPTRLTVDVRGLGWTGFAADELLHQELGVTAELPSLHHLTWIISLGNRAAEIERLIAAFQTLATRTSQSREADERSPLAAILSAPPARSHSSALTPRQAFFAPSQAVPVSQAIAQISAELICPYPPGIPVLIPGEVITAEAVLYLQQVLAAGGMITGGADPSLTTLKIVNPSLVG